MRCLPILRTHMECQNPQQHCRPVVPTLRTEEPSIGTENQPANLGLATADSIPERIGYNESYLRVKRMEFDLKELKKSFEDAVTEVRILHVTVEKISTRNVELEKNLPDTQKALRAIENRATWTTVDDVAAFCMMTNL